MSKTIGFLLVAALLASFAPAPVTASTMSHAAAKLKVHEGVNTTTIKGHKFVITVKNHKFVSATTWRGGKMVPVKEQFRSMNSNSAGKKFVVVNGCWEDFYDDYYPYEYLGSIWIC